MKTLNESHPNDLVTYYFYSTELNTITEWGEWTLKSLLSEPRKNQYNPCIEQIYKNSMQ